MGEQQEPAKQVFIGATFAAQTAVSIERDQAGKTGSMIASERYVQAACVDGLDSASALIESLPATIRTPNRLSVFCPKLTAVSEFGYGSRRPNSSNGSKEALAQLNQTLLGQREIFACHQRLSALGEQVLVVGSLASGAVTGSLSMFLQHHGLDRAIAREHEKQVANGQVLIVISCGGSEVDLCETIYETLSAAAS